MTFEIPFDKDISMAQYILRLKMTFKKNLDKSAVNVFWAGVILLFACFMLSDKERPGYGTKTFPWCEPIDGVSVDRPRVVKTGKAAWKNLFLMERHRGPVE
jgi:hypothetical protein